MVAPRRAALCNIARPSVCASPHLRFLKHLKDWQDNKYAFCAYKAYVLYVSDSSGNVANVRNSEMGATLYTILCLSIMNRS
jgi:hypothetical protein